MSYSQLPQYYLLQEQRVPDGVLVEQALAGDQGAFESLINRYHLQLVSYIRGFFKDQDQCYDVLQQVYLQLYLSLPTLSRSGSLKGWLYQVARNRCINELRKRGRRAEVPFSVLEGEDGEEGLSLLEAIADPEPLPEEMTERGERQGSVQAAMVTLPPKVRSIVHLHCFRQLTFSEIGRTLKMSEAAVKANFYRSLPHLRKSLASNMQCASIS